MYFNVSAFLFFQFCFNCLNEDFIKKIIVIAVYWYSSVLQGGREVDDFLKYLAKEASNELSGFDRDGKKKKKKKTEL